MSTGFIYNKIRRTVIITFPKNDIIERSQKKVIYPFKYAQDIFLLNTIDSPTPAIQYLQRH